MRRWSTDERDPRCSKREHEARGAVYSYAHYMELIGAIRGTAKRLGYAIGVHGTLARDIDLIAVPWVEDAESPHLLAESITDLARSFDATFVRCDEKEPGEKPHGRRCWSIHLEGGPWIDLSIMPRTGEKQ